MKIAAVIKKANVACAAPTVVLFEAGIGWWLI
jgi:hypothetical protein